MKEKLIETSLHFMLLSYFLIYDCIFSLPIFFNWNNWLLTFKSKYRTSQYYCIVELFWIQSNFWTFLVTPKVIYTISVILKLSKTSEKPVSLLLVDPRMIWVLSYLSHTIRSYYHKYSHYFSEKSPIILLMNCSCTSWRDLVWYLLDKVGWLFSFMEKCAVSCPY